MAKQTGPTTGTRNEPYFEVAHDVTTNGWAWRLWAGNGRPLCESAEQYGTQKHAVQAIRLLAGVLAKAKLIVRASGEEVQE